MEITTRLARYGSPDTNVHLEKLSELRRRWPATPCRCSAQHLIDTWREIYMRGWTL